MPPKIKRLSYYLFPLVLLAVIAVFLMPESRVLLVKTKPVEPIPTTLAKNDSANRQAAPVMESISSFEPFCGQNLVDVRDRILNSPFTSEAVLIENYHLKDQGQDLRIQILDSEGERGSQKMVRYFHLDNEELPIPIAVPKTYAELNVNAVREKALSFAPNFTQKKLIRSYAHNSEIRMTIENGILVSLEGQNQRQIIVCEQICRCEN